MTTRHSHVHRFADLSIIFISIITLMLFVMISLSHGAVPEVTRTEVAELAQTIESLQAQIADLQKQVQILSDLLWDITHAVNATTKPLTHSLTDKPALQSPKQIDREPFGDEKIKVYIAKLATAGLEEDMKPPLTKLLETRNTSNFVQSMRAQLIKWLDTPRDEKVFASPFSAKQYAWVLFLMYPGEYPNPKTVKELYPNATPASN